MSSSRPPRCTDSQQRHANSIDMCRRRGVGNGKAYNHADPLRTLSPHAVSSKLGREPPPAALARRCKKVEAAVPQQKLAAAALAHSTQPSFDCRVWTGPQRRRVRGDPSSWFGRAVPEAAVKGTHA